MITTESHVNGLKLLKIFKPVEHWVTIPLNLSCKDSVSESSDEQNSSVRIPL